MKWWYSASLVTGAAFVFAFVVGKYRPDYLTYLFIVLFSYDVIDRHWLAFNGFFKKIQSPHSQFVALFVLIVLFSGIADGFVEFIIPTFKEVSPQSLDLFQSFFVVLAVWDILQIEKRLG